MLLKSDIRLSVLKDLSAVQFIAGMTKRSFSARQTISSKVL